MDRFITKKHLRKMLLIAAGVIGYFIFSSGLKISQAQNEDGVPLELLVNGQDDPESLVNVADFKPGDTEIINNTVETDRDARIYLHLKDFISSQGTQTEPEIAEELIGGPRSDLETVTNYDLSVAGVPVITLGDNTTLVQAFSCWIPLGEIAAETVTTVEQSFHFDILVTNWAQGDVLSFTEEFLAIEPEDPTVPDTGIGRGWDPDSKKCVVTTVPFPS